ncbi:cupin domain-containing protein [Pseudoroseicyclus sp. H15]
MSERFLRLAREGAAPVTERPAPDRLIAGDPVVTTWSLEEAGDLYAGLWQCTPGKWRIVYDEWEYFRVLEGLSIVTEEGGEPLQMGPGDSLILRPGFTGTWEVVRTTLKEYVVRL